MWCRPIVSSSTGGNLHGSIQGSRSVRGRLDVLHPLYVSASDRLPTPDWEYHSPANPSKGATSRTVCTLASCSVLSIARASPVSECENSIVHLVNWKGSHVLATAPLKPRLPAGSADSFVFLGIALLYAVRAKDRDAHLLGYIMRPRPLKSPILLRPRRIGASLMLIGLIPIRGRHSVGRLARFALLPRPYPNLVAAVCARCLPDEVQMAWVSLSSTTSQTPPSPFATAGLIHRGANLKMKNRGTQCPTD